jgi:hypothetical protein
VRRLAAVIKAVARKITAHQADGDTPLPRRQFEVTRDDRKPGGGGCGQRPIVVARLIAAGTTPTAPSKCLGAHLAP